MQLQFIAILQYLYCNTHHRNFKYCNTIGSNSIYFILLKHIFDFFRSGVDGIDGVDCVVGVIGSGDGSWF